MRGEGVQQCGQVRAGDMQVFVHVEATDPLRAPIRSPFDGIELHSEL